MSTNRTRVSAMCTIGALVGSCSWSSTDKGFVADPRLECADGETQFNPPADLDSEAPGAPSAEAALRPTLDANVEARGEGEVVQLSQFDYGVSVDSRVGFIATAAETRPGQWHLADIAYCE